MVHGHYAFQTFQITKNINVALDLAQASGPCLISEHSLPTPALSSLLLPPKAEKVTFLASLPDSGLSLNSEPGMLVLMTLAWLYENSKHLRYGSRQSFQEQHLAAPRQHKVKRGGVILFMFVLSHYFQH